MHSISSCGLDIRKTNSIQFKLARKFAKLRAWSNVFEEDKIKGDAMAANYMHQKLPSYVKNGGDWKNKEVMQTRQICGSFRWFQGARVRGEIDREAVQKDRRGV